MLGLLSLIAVGVYIGIVGVMLYKTTTWWGKAIVLVAAVLIPNADDWYYRVSMKEYCKNVAGFKIYQRVSHTEGLYYPTAYNNGSSLAYISPSYVEWPKLVNSKVVGFFRADRNDDGSISKPYSILEKSANYEFGDRIEKPIGPFIEVRQQVLNGSTGSILGEFRTMFYYGSWYPRAFIGIGGLVAGCGKFGEVLSNRQWGASDDGMKGFDGGFGSYVELVNRVFSK
jgi:hypothetical protein